MVVVAVLAACSDDDGSPVEPDPTVVQPTTTTTSQPPPDVSLTVIRSDVIGPDAPTHPLVDPTLAEVVELVDRFLDVTSLHPLTGQPGPGLAGIMTDDAAQRATTTDRAVVFDEGVPPAPSVEAVEATVDLQALARPANQLELVVAGVVWEVKGAIGVRRTGELTLVPTADGWRISAYDLAVSRS